MAMRNEHSRYKKNSDGQIKSALTDQKMMATTDVNAMICSNDHITNHSQKRGGKTYDSIQSAQEALHNPPPLG